MNLYLLKFYSYQDRKFWMANSLEDYQENGFDCKAIDVGVSFKMNDGINTEQVTNYDPTGYNYLICEIDGTIKSRWYILKATKLRTNQYQLSLKRDTLADYLNSYKNSPFQIERGTIKNLDNPLIFQDEGLNLNKIKKQEILIKDELQIPWIVGYIKKDGLSESKTISYNDATSVSADITVGSLSGWKYASFIGNEILNLKKITTAVSVGVYSPSVEGPRWIEIFNEGTSSTYHDYINSEFSDKYTLNVSSDNVLNAKESVLENFKGQVYFSKQREYICEGIGAVTSTSQDYIKEINELNGKVIKDTSTSKVYRIRFYQSKTYEDTELNLDSNQEAYNYIVSRLIRSGDDWKLYGDDSTSKFKLHFWGSINKLVLEPIESKITVTIPNDSSRVHCNDCGYDIFAIPAGQVCCLDQNFQENFSTNISDAIKIAQEIAEQLTSSIVYDLQLIPFCPVRNAISLHSSYGYFIEYTNSKAPHSLITNSNGENISLIYWLKSNDISFTTDLTKSITTINSRGITSVDNFITTKRPTLPTEIQEGAFNTVKDRKIKYLTDSIRLCSPNYNGLFEINPAMNYGLSEFNIDMTLIPYTPYIHICPILKGLYGSDFKDARGLICSGDFSLSQNSDKWQEYKIQNKNYLNTFNTELDSLHRQQVLSNISNSIGAITGAIGAGVNGSTMAKVLGAGGLGLGIGTGLASLAGGIADTVINNQTMIDNIAKTKKSFGYSIGNIKSIGSSLTKISAININNKTFPFIEYYSCTDEEKTLVEMKLNYMGYSIGTIDYITNYQGGWFQGNLLRSSIKGIDSTIFNDLENELKGGIYLDEYSI